MNETFRRVSNFMQGKKFSNRKTEKSTVLGQGESIFEGSLDLGKKRGGQELPNRLTRRAIYRRL